MTPITGGAVAFFVLALVSLLLHSCILNNKAAHALHATAQEARGIGWNSTLLGRQTLAVLHDSLVTQFMSDHPTAYSCRVISHEWAPWILHTTDNYFAYIERDLYTAPDPDDPDIPTMNSAWMYVNVHVVRVSKTGEEKAVSAASAKHGILHDGTWSDALHGPVVANLLNRLRPTNTKEHS